MKKKEFKKQSYWINPKKRIKNLPDEFKVADVSFFTTMLQMINSREGFILEDIDQAIQKVKSDLPSNTHRKEYRSFLASELMIKLSKIKNEIISQWTLLKYNSPEKLGHYLINSYLSETLNDDAERRQLKYRKRRRVDENAWYPLHEYLNIHLLSYLKDGLKFGKAFSQAWENVPIDKSTIKDDEAKTKKLKATAKQGLENWVESRIKLGKEDPEFKSKEQFKVANTINNLIEANKSKSKTILTRDRN